MSDGKHYCLVVIDAFSRFFQVYPVKSTVATHTTEAMSFFKLNLGFVKSLFMIEELLS